MQVRLGAASLNSLHPLVDIAEVYLHSFFLLVLYVLFVSLLVLGTFFLLVAVICEQFVEAIRLERSVIFLERKLV